MLNFIFSIINAFLGYCGVRMNGYGEENGFIIYLIIFSCSLIWFEIQELKKKTKNKQNGNSDLKEKTKLEEFDNMSFGQFDKVEYNGKEYELAVVNLEERLIGLKEEEGVYWVRFENCKFL